MLQWVKTQKYPLLVGFLAALLLGAFVVWFVGSEKTIYTWDFANYWRPAMDLSNQMKADPSGAVETIINRTRSDEYNVLHATPPAIWMLVFDTSRMSYILSLYILYFLPATLLMAAVAFKILRPVINKFSKHKKGWAGLTLWLLIIANPIILVPLLRGYPDIIGLGVLSLALLIYMKYRTSMKVRWLVIIAVTLVLATLLRRWYLFGAVGLIIGMGIDQLVFIFKNKKLWSERIVRALQLLVLPITYVGTFVVIALPYVMHLMSTNYSANYSAYQRHDGYVELGWFTIQHFSLPLLLIAAFTLGWFIWKKYNRGAIAVMSIAAIFCFFAVGQVQSFDAHQYYLLTLPVVVGVALLPFVIAQMVTRRKKVVFSATLVALFALLGLNGYSLYINQLQIAPAVSARHFAPLRQNDLDEIKKMYQYVQTLGDDKSIYVLSCSNTFNIDTFRNVPLTLQDVTPIDYNNYLFTTQLDTRDGFNTGFFDADVVVDTDPIGYIAALDQQQIITYLHKEITDGILAPYYAQKYQYKTDEYGATVYVRTKDIPQDVREEVLNKVKSTHDNVRIFLASSPYG